MVVDNGTVGFVDAMVVDNGTVGFVDAMEVDASTDATVDDNVIDVGTDGIVVAMVGIVDALENAATDAARVVGADATVGDSRGKGTEVPTNRVARSREAVDTGDVAAATDTNEYATVDDNVIDVGTDGIVVAMVGIVDAHVDGSTCSQGCGCRCHLLGIAEVKVQRSPLIEKLDQERQWI